MTKSPEDIAGLLERLAVEATPPLDVHLEMVPLTWPEVELLRAYRNHHAEIVRVLNDVAVLREMLADAANQIEYLHGKFQETGSGNAVLAKIRAALTPTQTETK